MATDNPNEIINNNNSNNERMINNNQKTDLSFCILWSPLFPVTLFLPFIGHTGIATSRGIANDFQGSYYVGTDGHMAFGAPTRYLKLDPSSLPGGVEQWDSAIEEANRVYSQRIHNICCDNCHSHVALALTRMELEAFGIRKWDMVKLCFLIFFKGRFISFGGFLCQFLPFTMFVVLMMLVGTVI
jgi:hypothetical protein